MAKIRNHSVYPSEDTQKMDYIIGKEKCNICQTYEATVGGKCESCGGILRHMVDSGRFNVRRSGQTTRLVDRWIQEFFDKGITYIYEGRGERSEIQQTEYAYKKFKNRMRSEHSNIEFDVKYGEFDRIKCFKVTKK